MGGVLALLALGIVGGLFVLQFQLLLAKSGETLTVAVDVERDGTLWAGNVTLANATALRALLEAGDAGGFEVEVREYPGQGAYVARIGPHREADGEGWLYCVGRDPCDHPKVAADRYALRAGDRLLWHWGTAADGI